MNTCYNIYMGLWVLIGREHECLQKRRCKKECSAVAVFRKWMKRRDFSMHGNMRLPTYYEI